MIEGRFDLIVEFTVFLCFLGKMSHDEDDVVPVVHDLSWVVEDPEGLASHFSLYPE